LLARYATPPLPPSPLFPYTTLFRSPLALQNGAWTEDCARGTVRYWTRVETRGASGRGFAKLSSSCPLKLGSAPVAASCRHRGGRSEEHTSELQSRSDLVCRLLLEKK